MKRGLAALLIFGMVSTVMVAPAQAAVDATPVLHHHWTQAAALSGALAGEEAASVTVSADSGRCERLLSAAGEATSAGQGTSGHHGQDHGHGHK